MCGCRRASGPILKSLSDLGVRSRWLGGFFVGLYCWSTIIAFPSVSLIDGLLPPLSILKVSVELSLSLSPSAGWWDHRYSHCSWLSNMHRGLRRGSTSDHYEWQVILLEAVAATVNLKIQFFTFFFTFLYLHQPDRRNGCMNVACWRFVCVVLRATVQNLKSGLEHSYRVFNAPEHDWPNVLRWFK